jgi:hypothetical protein
MQQNKKKEGDNVAVVAFWAARSSLCCVATQLEKRTKKVTTPTTLPSPSSLRYATAQLHKRRKKAMVALLPSPSSLH